MTQIKETRIIHVIRDKDGSLMATARGLHPLAAMSWKDKGCEIFAFEIELPFQVGADFISQARPTDAT